MWTNKPVVVLVRLDLKSWNRHALHVKRCSLSQDQDCSWSLQLSFKIFKQLWKINRTTGPLPISHYISLFQEWQNNLIQTIYPTLFCWPSLIHIKKRHTAVARGGILSGFTPVLPVCFTCGLLLQRHHSFSHLTRTTLIERGGARADWISEDRIGFDARA